MRSTLTCTCAIVLLASCDAPPRNPVAPDTIPVPVRPAAVSYTLSGAVTAGGAPVAGARVVALDLDQESSASATTDGNGHYSIPAVSASVSGMSPLLSASKPGYFTDVKFANANYVPISKDTQLDFELDPWVHISLGEVIRGRIGVDDAVCSHWGYGATACQRFALTVPASGTLEVTIYAPVRNFDVDVVSPDGTFAFYDAFPSVSPLRVRIPVEAGSTYQIRLAGGPAEFDLTTALD